MVDILSICVVVLSSRLVLLSALKLLLLQIIVGYMLMLLESTRDYSDIHTAALFSRSLQSPQLIQVWILVDRSPDKTMNDNKNMHYIKYSLV